MNIFKFERYNGSCKNLASLRGIKISQIQGELFPQFFDMLNARLNNTIGS